MRRRNVFELYTTVVYVTIFAALVVWLIGRVLS